MTNTLSTICIDSNFVIRLVIGGPHAAEVEKQWEQWVHDDVTLVAPPLFAFEVTSVIWREVYRKTLTLEQGRKALQTALSQDVQLKYPSNLHERTWKIVHRFHQSQAYDAHYVALADWLNCEFWTLDKKLYKTLSDKLPWVHTIPSIEKG